MSECNFFEVYIKAQNIKIIQKIERMSVQKTIPSPIKIVSILSRRIQTSSEFMILLELPHTSTNVFFFIVKQCLFPTKALLS